MLGYVLSVIAGGLINMYTGALLGWSFQMITSPRASQIEQKIHQQQNESTALLTPVNRDTDPALESSSSSAFQEKDYRSPFAMIGRSSCGSFGEWFIIINQVIGLFGVCVIFILFSANNLNLIWPEHVSQ